MDERPHSGFGIVSCVLAGLLVLLEAGGFITAGILGQSSSAQNTSLLGLIGLAVLLGILVGLVGLGMAVAGLLQKGRKRTFAVLGLAVNAVVTLGAGVLVIVGMIMNHRKG